MIMKKSDLSWAKIKIREHKIIVLGNCHKIPLKKALVGS